MGFSQTTLTTLLLVTQPIVQSPNPSTGHLLYLAQKGEIERAIQGYRQLSENGHDFALLRQLGLVILQGGQSARSDAGQLLALYGAGIAQDRQLFEMIRSGVSSRSPEVQMIAIELLDQFGSDEADDWLLRAMGSDFLLPRLEAALRLANKGHPQAVEQLRSLMAKVIPELQPLFAELFALTADHEGDAVLRKLLSDGTPATKRVAVLSLGRLGRDDFLGEIRRISTRLDPLQQEAAAAALGMLRDSSSAQRLWELASSAEETVRVAALQSLCALGYEEAVQPLMEMAKAGSLFAMLAIPTFPGSDEVFAGLVSHPDLNIRVGAALALLERRDVRCLPPLREILITDSRGLGILPKPSLGGGLLAFEVVHAIEARGKKEPELAELSRSIREGILRELVELDEQAFFTIAEAIFAAKQNDLVPLLVRLLENHGGEKATRLLQQERQHAGAPLIRNYCNLALFRMGEEGPYREALCSWIARQADHPLLELRPILPWTKRRVTVSEFQLAPEETSRLLIESYEAMAQCQDLAAVDALLDGIEQGHPDNRYVLAALLIRAIE